MNVGRTQVCVQPRLLGCQHDTAHMLLCAVLRRRCSSAPAPAIDRIFSSKPAALRCCCRTMRRTDGRTLDSFIDPAPHTTRAASIISVILTAITLFSYNNIACLYYQFRRIKDVYINTDSRCSSHSVNCAVCSQLVAMKRRI